MEKILQKNIEHIKKYSKLIDIDKLDYLNNEKFIVEKCVDNQSYTIKGKYKDGYVYFHSRYEPEREGEILASSMLDTSSTNSLFIIYGFGFGYKFRHLLNKLDENSKIFIIEPDYEIFNFAIRHVDISKILENDKIILIIEKDMKTIENIFRDIIGFKNIDLVEGTISKPYIKLYEDNFNDYYDSMSKIMIHAKLTKNTLGQLSKTWFKNALKNLNDVLNSFDASKFEGVLSGRPAVLVSSGPSLDKNVHLLKNLQRKVFIIAAYTTINTLIKHGIVPDMYVSIDGRQIIYPTPEEYPFDMPLLCESSANPDLLKIHNGKKIVTFTILDIFYIEIFKNINKDIFLFNTGASVACMMLDFLFKAGADPIIFIGQDMAFSEGKNHTDGYHIFGDENFNEEKNNIESVPEKIIYVDDIHGGKVPTSHSFYIFLTWFNSYTGAFKNQARFIDATEGGAKIDNTEICTFQEAIDKYCTNIIQDDLPNILEEAYDKFNFFEENEKKLVLKILKDTNEAIEKVDILSKDGIIESENLEKLYKNSQQPNNKKVLNILSKFKNIDEELDKLKSKTKILDLAFQDVIMQINNPRERNISEGLDIALKTKLLYESYIEVNKISKPLLEEAIEFMEKGGF